MDYEAEAFASLAEMLGAGKVDITTKPFWVTTAEPAVLTEDLLCAAIQRAIDYDLEDQWDNEVGVLEFYEHDQDDGEHSCDPQCDHYDEDRGPI